MQIVICVASGVCVCIYKYILIWAQNMMYKYLVLSRLFLITDNELRAL